MTSGQEMEQVYSYNTRARMGRPVKVGCWFVGGDDLTAALHVL